MKHAILWGDGAMPPGNLIILSEIEFESDLGTNNTGDCSILGNLELEFK